MAPTIGALATVLFVDTEHDLLWVRYGNGNAGFLDPDNGPSVNVGTVLLVALDDSSFVEAPAEVFPKQPDTGALATVVLGTTDDLLWVRYANGGFGPLHRDGGPTVSLGSVVLVSGSTFVPAPRELLTPKTGIGVVRRVEEARSLVETEHSITWLPHEGAVDWQEWSTVELSETGIVKQLDESPLRYRDDPPASRAVHSRFRVDPTNVTETFDGIEGLDSQIAELRQIIEMMHNAEALKEKGMRPIAGSCSPASPEPGRQCLHVRWQEKRTQPTSTCAAPRSPASG